MTIKTKRLARNIRDFAIPFIFPRLLGGGDSRAKKIERILYYRRKISADIFVETGTYFGQTTETAARHFKQVYTIELSSELAESNRRDFSGVENVTVIQGDSGIELEAVVKKVKTPVIIWLDGHYSGGVTSCGVDVCPIFRELRCLSLLDSSVAFVIIVDDKRLFTGVDGYPTQAEFESRVRAVFKNIQIVEDSDAIVISSQV